MESVWQAVCLPTLWHVLVASTDARGSRWAADAWAPEIVLLARPVPEQLRERLEQVVHRLPRVGIAGVTGAGACAAGGVGAAAAGRRAPCWTRPACA